jgi:hypothetical protein
VDKQTFRANTLNGSGYRPNNDIDELQGVSNPTATSSLDESSLISYVGRLNYEYAGKYLLSGSIRRDGSSRFAPGNKWGTFPFLSLGWRISEEEFLKSIPQISELKIRASYGQTGFNGIGSYAWQSLVSADNSNYVFGGNKVLGSYFSSLANTQLKWESTTMTNLGLTWLYSITASHSRLKLTKGIPTDYCFRCRSLTLWVTRPHLCPTLEV